MFIEGTKVANRYSIKRRLGSGTFDELPVTVVMDRAGNTVKKFSGFTKPEDIRAAIDKAL